MHRERRHALRGGQKYVCTQQQYTFYQPHSDAREVWEQPAMVEEELACGQPWTEKELDDGQQPCG